MSKQELELLNKEKEIEYLHPSNKPNAAKTKNGDALPTNSYMNPPNGGPTRRKKKMVLIQLRINPT